MLFKCNRDCWDSKRAIYFRAGKVYSSVPENLQKFFKKLNKPNNIEVEKEEDEYLMLVKKLNLKPTAVKEIAKSYGAKSKEALIPILKDLLAKQEKEKKK